eukprot:CAMPEP_0174241494 /NCGR_PEP_ID=MMETSP0417-20130205/23533_1 /TAXON_ID=242541 /ORGANISM="Mayorella sp, Strain BSH-02190019" /LENGTH=87 /DNA_ID=CAMNT_0015320741 /DNA_START=63 /DNA_END=326 /DNA_ORIENTATION=-
MSSPNKAVSTPGKDDSARTWFFLSMGTAVFVAVTSAAMFAGPVIAAGVGLSSVVGLWAYTQQQDEQERRLRDQDHSSKSSSSSSSPE